MIESIKANNYEAYQVIPNNTVTSQQTQNESEIFDIKKILSTLKDYGYSEKDIESVDAQLAEGLKSKFDLTQEEILRFKKNGYDLERLYMEDMTAYTAVQGMGTTGLVDENNAKVQQIGQKVDAIKKQNDSMYLYALTSNQPVTINSLYESNFKGDFKKSNTRYTGQDITKVLQMNGLADNKGNRWAASTLVEYGIDINQQKVVQLQNMKASIECLDQQEEMKKAQQDLEQDKMPGERPLIQNNGVLYDTKTVKNIKDDLGKIDDNAIEAIIENNEEITIDNLRASLFKNTELALKEPGAPTLNQGYKESVAEVKEQINHIRAKLTNEAAQRISEKMPLESSQLSEIVQELNAVEETIITEALGKAELEPTAENIEIVSNVIAVRQQILENTQQTLEIEVATNEQARLNEIEAALAKYYENETPVEQRFGENIRTVENQIQQILEAQGIEATSENIQGAKALITNGIEVTPESIQEVQQIILKVNTFIEEMTPNRAATLIKEGLNPYTATVDTLLDWISEDKVEVLKNNIAESIVALEEKGLVNQEQKETLLGFYRILQTVSKNREEVVGYVFKNEMPLTIQKLQEATRYIGKKQVIEATVDDQFGEITALKYQNQTAKMMIEENRESIAKTIDVVKLLENMNLPITEDSVSKLQKINALLYPIIKEQFKKELGKFDGLESLPQSFLEKLEAIKKVDPEVIQEMLKKEIPLTVSHIYWTDKLLKEPELYRELLREGKLLKEELPDSLNDIKHNLEEQEEEAIAYKEVALQKGDVLQYKTYKQIEEMTQLQQEFSDREGLYQIPFLVNGEEKMVSMYFNKKQNQQGEAKAETKVIMTYETKNLGIITTYIAFKEDTVSYKMKGETKDITKALQQNDRQLEKLLTQIGYVIGKSEYKIEETETKENIISTMLKRGEGSFEELV